MKTPSKLDYSNVPGIKSSVKVLVKAVLRSLYLGLYRLPVDQPIVNKNGIKGVFLVASYTDKDKGYLDGLIESSRAFEKIILYHDRKHSHSFGFNESLRFQHLVKSATRNGAKWVFIGSPKTRFSKEFKSQIRPYIEKYSGQEVVLSLHERYLWGSFDQYANVKIVKDGVRVEKFFSVTDNMMFDGKAIHAIQRPVNYLKVIQTEASRYYLGRFNLAMMKEKADFYRSKDGKDYSYLHEMSKPIKHHETILGIGDYEKKELIN